MVTVNISLDNETAKIYEKAPLAEKKKMQVLFQLQKFLISIKM